VGLVEFTVSVNCSAGGVAHKHEVVIRADEGGVHGSSPPQPIRLQYRCPVAASDHKVRFTPPVGAARPFEVIEVK
jgi:hypothetical protein